MADDLTPGTILRGKYRVERFLGAGGMGRVLEGFHLDLERRVAIKVLHPDLRAHAELVTRFIREGRAAAKIEGDHVAKVLDVDKLEDGTPFLVMEFLEGADLSSVRKSATPLPVRDAVDYVLQACEAICDAHAHGIIHRDVKPANLFLTKKRDGTPIVKVLDFGISKVSNAPGGSEPSMTRTSIVMGSAEYMSPEQMLSTRDVDVRTDVWALGAVLFELLTARPPFAGETMTQVCAMVMSQPAPSPRAFRSEVSVELEQIILTCLQKEREARFASVTALARALTTSLLSLEGSPTTAPLPHLPAPGNTGPHMGVMSASMAPSVVAQPTPRMGPPDGLPTRVFDENERRSMPGNSAPPHPGAHGPSNRTTISSSGFPSGGGLDTNIPVSHEPIPAPPMRKSGVVIAAVIAMALSGVGAAALAVMRLGASKSASSGGVVTSQADPSLDKPRESISATSTSTIVVAPAPLPNPSASAATSLSVSPTAPPSAAGTGNPPEKHETQAKPQKSVVHPTPPQPKATSAPIAKPAATID